MTMAHLQQQHRGAVAPSRSTALPRAALAPRGCPGRAAMRVLAVVAAGPRGKAARSAKEPEDDSDAKNDKDKKVGSTGSAARSLQADGRAHRCSSRRDRCRLSRRPTSRQDKRINDLIKVLNEKFGAGTVVRPGATEYEPV
jgi:hypothetical protein